MDCSSASAAVRVCDWGEGVQWPNERKPIFFMTRSCLSLLSRKFCSDAIVDLENSLQVADRSSGKEARHKLACRRFQLFQEFHTGLRDEGRHLAPIILCTFSLDPACPFHPVKQT